MLVTSKGKTQSTQELVNASIQVLIDALESGHSEVLTSYLKAMAKFRNYSFGNILLIATQKPNATHVAGIRSWNLLGRRVRRGEKGIMIFAPMLGRTRKESQQTDAKDADSQVSVSLVGFRPVYVWDVLQTEGKELPKFDEPQGDVTSQLPKLIEFVKKQGIKLDYSDKIAPAKGMSYGGAIRILPNLNEAEQFSTLVHELAHEMLHKSERRTLTTKTVRETEAEAIAFVVANAIGLQGGTASSDYIQLYHGNAKLLQESLEVVQRTSAVILGAITPEPVKQEETGENKNEASVEAVQ